MKLLSNQIFLVVIILVTLAAFFLQPSDNSLTIISYSAEEMKSDKFDHTYSAYNSLLNKYLQNAKVDYQGFIKSRAAFEQFLKSIGAVNEDDYQNWTEEQRLAYWINAYNAFTIKAIIDHFPIKRSFSLVGIFYAPSNSILQIKGVWTKLKFRAVSRMVTLDEIEHQILRKKFNEPRIHMAINCASISCPDLSSEAYTADKLEVQLSEASSNFVNNPDKGVYIKQKNGRVKLSKIFKWFGDDFIPKYGSEKLFKNYSLKENAVLDFVTNYIESEITKEYLMNNKLKIGYLSYDWHLNEQQTQD